MKQHKKKKKFKKKKKNGADVSNHFVWEWAQKKSECLIFCSLDSFFDPSNPEIKF